MGDPVEDLFFRISLAGRRRWLGGSRLFGGRRLLFRSPRWLFWRSPWLLRLFRKCPNATSPVDMIRGGVSELDNDNWMCWKCKVCACGQTCNWHGASFPLACRRRRPQAQGLLPRGLAVARRMRADSPCRLQPQLMTMRYHITTPPKRPHPLPDTHTSRITPVPLPSQEM